MNSVFLGTNSGFGNRFPMSIIILAVISILYTLQTALC